MSLVEDLAAGWRGLPGTDGVLLWLGEEGRVVVRPSGTEAKLKAYLEVTPRAAGSLSQTRERGRRLIDALRADLDARLAP